MIKKVGGGFYLYYNNVGLSGIAQAGQSVDFGVLPNPSGYSISSVIFMPEANVPIILSLFNGHVYCYSINYNGELRYSALLIFY